MLQRGGVFQHNDQDSTTLNFDGRSSSTDPTGRQTGINVFGYSFADFMMGRVATFTTVGIIDYNIHTYSTFLFAQDEWKAGYARSARPRRRTASARSPRPDRDSTAAAGSGMGVCTRKR